MDTPLIISGSAHGALILFLLFGGWFESEPLPPVESTEVTVLSEEEFAVLTRPETVEEPEPVPMESAEEPTAAVDPAAPEEESPPEEPRVAEPAAEAVPEPEPEPEPEPAPEPEPQPEPVVEPIPAPDLDPAPRPERPDVPQDDTDTPQAAPRVADEVTPAPPLEAETAPEQQEATAPEPEPQLEPVEEEAPAAPEETTTEIVTEAEDPSTTLADAAPSQTARPRGRPEQVVAVEPEPEPEPVEPEPAPQTEGQVVEANSDNVQTAVEETIAGLEQMVEEGAAPGMPAGPPITEGERQNFILAIRRCWNVDVGSEAADVNVTIRFDMTPDGMPVSSSITQLSATGGSEMAQRAAYDSGRRAILRCAVEGSGYDLPPEKYAQWQQVEVTFNPAEMRVR
ncbi:hypothetical protein SAMN04488020_107100 [Palleronia marisminoris]|uniref:Cell division and transport-associated protein TolA n=1 Tax=Palleronia marisminoris TaxID=315423 RepID=A0A1Y5T3J3_9RHOB|nr:hypothetical protein [Palleronia marisminoris]SFH14653.1 hypothetical protein SAMN04488020_107100 [Palleronia marisminoris]SLN54559.1 hypothetical protein PAM7066_02573 [Palleronia marisminoris]